MFYILFFFAKKGHICVRKKISQLFTQFSVKQTLKMSETAISNGPPADKMDLTTKSENIKVMHILKRKCLLPASWQETLRSAASRLAGDFQVSASRLAADLKVSCQPAGRRPGLLKILS